MNRNEFDPYIAIINTALLKSVVKINKWREKFMLEVLLLYQIIPKRINFLQLGCYGHYVKQRYRQQFGRKFDWFSFNSSLAFSHIGKRVAIAFNPSYISKSGKRTPYFGRFWSGCVKMAKKGLEISGIGIIDMDLHSCFHLEAIQTPPSQTLEQVKWTLVDWYLHVLRMRKEVLLRLTRYVVADAYFSKLAFVDGAVGMGFHVVSRFRDAKQFTGLTDCQSRDLDKLRFHFNAALTSVNIAKANALEKGIAFSMASVKVLCHNIFLMQRFISISGIKPDKEINRKLWEEGIRFAAIAA